MSPEGLAQPQFIVTQDRERVEKDNRLRDDIWEWYRGHFRFQEDIGTATFHKARGHFVKAKTTVPISKDQGMHKVHLGRVTDVKDSVAIVLDPPPPIRAGGEFVEATLYTFSIPVFPEVKIEDLGFKLAKVPECRLELLKDWLASAAKEVSAVPIPRIAVICSQSLTDLDNQLFDLGFLLSHCAHVIDYTGQTNTPTLEDFLACNWNHWCEKWFNIRRNLERTVDVRIVKTPEDLESWIEQILRFSSLERDISRLR